MVANKTAVVLQDVFLNLLRKDGIRVTLQLLDGRDAYGVITGFDRFVVLLDNEGQQSMVYKHAIVQVVPERNVPMNAGNRR